MHIRWLRTLAAFSTDLPTRVVSGGGGHAATFCSASRSHARQPPRRFPGRMGICYSFSMHMAILLSPFMQTRRSAPLGSQSCNRQRRSVRCVFLRANHTSLPAAPAAAGNHAAVHAPSLFCFSARAVAQDGSSKLAAVSASRRCVPG